MEVKKNSSCEANERCDSPTHKPLESSKSQSPTFDPNDFLSFYSTEEEKEAQNKQQKQAKGRVEVVLNRLANKMLQIMKRICVPVIKNKLNLH